jgi:hypothetical protein
VGLLDRLFLLAARRGGDPAGFAWTVLAERGKRLMRDGVTLEGEEANLAEMRRLYATWQADGKGWLERLGIGA